MIKNVLFHDAERNNTATNVKVSNSDEDLNLIPYWRYFPRCHVRKAKQTTIHAIGGVWVIDTAERQLKLWFGTNIAHLCQILDWCRRGCGDLLSPFGLQDCPISTSGFWNNWEISANIDAASLKGEFPAFLWICKLQRDAGVESGVRQQPSPPARLLAAPPLAPFELWCLSFLSNVLFPTEFLYIGSQFKLSYDSVWICEEPPKTRS
jgi:hypothetical protein